MVPKNKKLLIAFGACTAIIGIAGWLFFFMGEKDTIHMNQTIIPRSELIRLALNHGDTIAYNGLSLEYFDSPYDSFLIIAKTMADKYSYRDAQMDVFYYLTDYYSSDIEDTIRLENIEVEKRLLALRYLELASNNKLAGAVDIWNKLCHQGKYLYRDEKGFCRLGSVPKDHMAN